METLLADRSTGLLIEASIVDWASASVLLLIARLRGEAFFFAGRLRFGAGFASDLAGAVELGGSAGFVVNGSVRAGGNSSSMVRPCGRKLCACVTGALYGRGSCLVLGKRIRPARVKSWEPGI